MFLKRIKDLREDTDLRGSDLARILGVSTSNYSRWETDECLIPIKHLNNLCNYFHVSIDYMIGLSDEKAYDNMKLEINRETIGKRIKTFRKQNYLTQEKLAEELHTSHSTISSYEHGKTMILTAFAYDICTKFSLSFDYLIGRTEENKLK